MTGRLKPNVMKKGFEDSEKAEISRTVFENDSSSDPSGSRNLCEDIGARTSRKRTVCEMSASASDNISKKKTKRSK